MLRVPDLELAPEHPERAVLATIAKRLDVSVGGVELLGSMAAYIQHGQAIRPQLHDVRRQQALTDRFLTPALPALKNLLLDLRAELDPGLRKTQPLRGAKPYPIGQCLEITAAVQRGLEGLGAVRLSGVSAQACAALREFTDAGGAVRRAWGDLRGAYFQSALIIGTLYVDVANDTVVVSKPPVEILPFAEADFKPIADYFHFAKIATRYWGHRHLPNHFLPQLAPYFPLIEITPNGGLRLGPLHSYMLSLTLENGFSPSEQVLAASALPAATFDSLAPALWGAWSPTPGRAEEGRQAALSACQRYRAEARQDCPASFNGAMLAARQVNRRLARLIVVPRVRQETAPFPAPALAR